MPNQAESNIPAGYGRQFREARAWQGLSLEELARLARKL